MKPANLMLYGMILASLTQAGPGDTERLAANSQTLLEAAEDMHADIEQPVVLIDDEED